MRYAAVTQSGGGHRYGGNGAAESAWLNGGREQHSGEDCTTGGTAAGGVHERIKGGVGWGG